jgi:hypothetical protein
MNPSSVRTEISALSKHDRFAILIKEIADPKEYLYRERRALSPSASRPATLLDDLAQRL